jgi:hypothetical protein
MKHVLVAMMVLAMAVPAFAGENPNAVVFVSFAPDCPDPYVHTTDFTGMGMYDAYVCVGCFGDGGSIRALSFSMAYTGGLSPMLPDYSVFDATAQGTGGPGGDWLIGAGVCVAPNACGIVTVVRQQFFAGGPGTISLGASSIDGKMVVDCNFDADFFCVCGNGAIGMDAPAGDEGCDCLPSPVEDSTWGTIKSLYR